MVEYPPPYINPYPTKARQLKYAFKCGLNIPQTNIINNKKALLELYNKNNKNIITKSLCNPYVFQIQNELYCTYTTEVEKLDIEKQDSIFFPSLFQNNIIKNLELRIFYFLGKFYSYAIFSSLNRQTNIDSRIYDHNKPNRLMKYELPNNIKFKLIHFMEKLNLHTGSIDMIINDSNEYIFLEVNPQGQFGGMADYELYIEYDIANFLFENDK